MREKVLLICSECLARNYVTTVNKERDAFLRENGFLVYRIPWNTVNTENGRQLMKEKIDKFLEFYNSLKE